MIRPLLVLVRRDLLLAARRRAEVATVLFFFVITASLFPFGVGPEPELLKAVGTGVVWVSALLATMLSLPRMFAGDYADGTLEQMILSPEPLSLVVVAKVTAHWLVSGLPLVVLAPVLGIQFGLEGGELQVLWLGLVLGTPTLSFIGGIGAALTLGVRGGGMLVSLLVLPLYIPILIFGAGAVLAEGGGLGAEAHLLLLGAGLAGAAALAPWATALALRISIE